MTSSRWVREAAVLLRDAGIDAPRLEAQVLAAHANGVDRPALLAHPDADIDADAEGLLSRRLAGEPLAYILEYREFFGRRFRVTPAVLIPRQESEILVEVAVRIAARGAGVLDVGSGSGCLAITIKLERDDLEVVGVDVSAPALGVAAANAAALGAAVTFSHSDLFSEVARKFDLIVSNPPYVADHAQLSVEVRGHEPALALFGGPDGMTVYRRIAVEAPAHLRDGGKLALELGDGMATRVAGCFEEVGWATEDLFPDLGGEQRVLVVSKPTS